MLYSTLNGYYEFKTGVYVGIGGGFATIKTSLNHTALAKVSKTNMSPMGAVMLGWTHPVNDKLTFDLRYRFSMFSGTEFNDLDVHTKIGMIMNNSLSAGLRYAF